jgi:CRP-like cAMP-binding protein
MTEANGMILARMDLLKGLSQEDLQILGGLFQPSDWAEGDTIFREQDPGGSLFAIESGTVKIYKESVTGRKVLASLSGGEIFGELSLFDRSPRSATGVASTGVRLWTLDGVRLTAAFAEHPQLGVRFLIQLVHQVGRRLRQTNERLQDHVLWGLTGRL